MYIDGFNTVITLEIALCQSLLLRCMDGTIRDLAGLRGTYRLIEETPQAVQIIADALSHLKVKKAKKYGDNIATEKYDSYEYWKWVHENCYEEHIRRLHNYMKSYD